MAEQFLTLMADLDKNSQAIMSEWYGSLKEAGFLGTQTPGLPYHISLATFPLEKEQEAVALTRKVAETFSPISVHISHIGMFAGGKVLFGAPETSPELLQLHDACTMETNPEELWTPHVTVLIDKTDVVYAALPIFVNSFHPWIGKITRLHLCAFWPTREIVSIELNGHKGEI